MIDGPSRRGHERHDQPRECASHVFGECVVDPSVDRRPRPGAEEHEAEPAEHPLERDDLTVLPFITSSVQSLAIASAFVHNCASVPGARRPTRSSRSPGRDVLDSTLDAPAAEVGCRSKLHDKGAGRMEVDSWHFLSVSDHQRVLHFEHASHLSGPQPGNLLVAPCANDTHQRGTCVS